MIPRIPRGTTGHVKVQLVPAGRGWYWAIGELSLGQRVREVQLVLQVQQDPVLQYL